MPLFKRSDGDLVRGLSTMRRMMPYVIKGRNEGVVYYEQILDLTRTLPFLEAWNRTHEQKLTLFHLLVAACGKTLHARPGLNRFVSGKHIYQHRGVNLSFAAKKAFRDEAPIVTVKVAVPEGEAIEATAKRIGEAVGEGRSDKERTIDNEMKLGLAIPGFLLTFVLWLMGTLDRWNLLPGAVTKNDPAYGSAFIANLGSLGLDRAYHHLFEYGTCSLFIVLGAMRTRLVPGAGGAPETRMTVRLRYSYDERINDGFYCASSLEILRRYMEEPQRFVDEPVPDLTIPLKPGAGAL